jgi:hypothetical protein
MLVDSEYVGDWMASDYLSSGVRLDHALSLRPDGGYVWRTRHEGLGKRCERGTWRHDHGQRTLSFSPSEPGPAYHPDNPQLWGERQVEGMEGANTVMVLRWVALGVLVVDFGSDGCAERVIVADATLAPEPSLLDHLRALIKP